MKHGKLITVLLIASACSSSGSKDSTSVDKTYVVTIDPAADAKKMQWLTGSWKGMYQGKPFYEAWHPLNDSVMINYAIEITEVDTLINASGTIHTRGENFFYGTDSIYWKLGTMTPEELIFKNDTLAYSRTILWKHTANDHWYTKLTNPNGSVAEYDLVKQPELDLYVIEFIKKNPAK